VPGEDGAAGMAARGDESLLPAPSSCLVERVCNPHPTQPAETDPGIITLYHGFATGSLNCIFSTKCRLLIEVCGLPYRIVDVDLDAKPAWFGEISPKLEAPVAYVQGELIGDSSLIMSSVKSLVLDQGLGSRSGAAAMLGRESLLSADALDGTMGAFFGITCTPPGSAGEAGALEKWLSVIGQYEAVLEFSDYLCGTSLGVADLDAFPLVRLCVPMLECSHGVKGSETAPRVLAWLDRLADELAWAMGGLAGTMAQVEDCFKRVAKKVPPAAEHLGVAEARAHALNAPSSCLVERLRNPHPTQPAETDPGIITLYHGYQDGRLMCIYSLKVRWLLEELGLPYRIVDVDLDAKPAWFGEISPKLQCPVACIEGIHLADSGPIMTALLKLAGTGAAERPEFVSRQSFCKIDQHNAELATQELGSFLQFCATPPTGAGAAAAQDAWESSVSVFEECLSNSGKPFLCGDAPGRLDAEAMFWRIALPMSELAAGWKCKERAPHMAGWVSRMEATDSMRHATDGTARSETQVAQKLRALANKLPSVEHLQLAEVRARQLAESPRSDSGDRPSASSEQQVEMCEQLMGKVTAFAAAVTDSRHQKIVLQFVKSAFLEQVKDLMPRRRYGGGVAEWTEDVLDSADQKKMILSSMVSTVLLPNFSLGIQLIL